MHHLRLLVLVALFLAGRPDGDAFAATLRVEQMLGRRVTVESFTVLDSAARAQGPAPCTATNDTLTFSTTAHAFAHRLNFH